MNIHPLPFVLSAALLTLTSCSTSITATAKRELPFRVSPNAPVTGKTAKYDHSSCAKIPDTPTSFAYRLVLKAIPYTRENAFYGNWAGSGCRGGLPVDAMDEIFRRHDIAYAESCSLETLRLADAACVEALTNLDVCGLSPEALEYRDRSIRFFSNGRLAWVGKPVTSLWNRKESAHCPFQTDEDMRALFGLEQKAADLDLSPAAAPARWNTELAARPDRPKLKKPRQLLAFLGNRF